MSNMEGKTVVITGATKGIGKAVAEKFAQNGVNIAFTYHSNEEVAQEVAADLMDKYSIKAKAYPLNILELDGFKPLFLAIDKDFDRVDFFVSNAMIYGRSIIGGYGKFMKLRPAKGLQNIYTTTVGAFVRGSQEAAVRMGTTEEDIAKAVYFLCTEESSWITGQTLIVDGGTTFR